jgi:hypothetical protein
MPVTGSQASAVHGFPSFVTRGVPATHVPEEHVSAPLHTVPSGHAVPFGFVGFEQTPVDVLHVPTSWHWSLAVQTTGFEPVQVPDWQASVCVQAFESLHEAPFAFAGFEQTPVDVLHVPTSWHWSLALQTTGFEPLHVPDWHVSVWVQAFESLHEVPFDFAGFEQMPVDGLHVPTSWHWSLAVQTTGVPATHEPFWQVSVPLQGLPSSQPVPQPPEPTAVFMSAVI